MPVEVAKLVDDFNKLWPRGTDPVSKADDHIRMIKEVLKLEFELLYNKTRVFSFEAGAVVNPDCILYYEAEKAFYQWNGAYDVNNKYIVNAGSTPETAGGIGGNAWTRSTGSGFMSTVLVSDTEPTTTFQNMLWWDTNSGTFFIYYNDGTSTQWVDLFGIADQASFNTLLFRSVLARLAAESGYTLVGGSFQEGAISSGFSDVVLDWNTAKFYQWHLNENKEVPAGSTPSSTGGVGAGAWVDRSDVVLRDQLAESTGATKVGYNSITVAEALDAKPNTSDVNKALAAKANSATLVSRTKKGGLTQSIARNALTLTQEKRLFNFRSSTLTNGNAVEVTLPSDMTITVPNGATLGGVSDAPLEILVLGIYNSGSPVIGVVNANCGLALDESGLISATAISVNADSASVVYSSVTVTNSPYIILARLTVTLPSAGAWSVLPTVTPIDLIGVSMMSRRMVIPAIATTSGAAIDQAIPPWARRITIMFNGVSTSGASLPLLRFGTPTVAASGYSSSAFNSTSASVNNIGNTTGFILVSALNALAILRGGITLLSPDGVMWTESGVTSDSAYVTNSMSSGSVTLSALATVLRLTTVNGTDTFDAGSISLLIEG